MNIHFYVLLIILKKFRIVWMFLRNIFRIRRLNRYCKNRKDIGKIRIRRIRKRESRSALMNVKFVL
jgi:hypothetical protein